MDYSYWDNYYANQKTASDAPTHFAQSVKPLLEKGRTLLELGCGNGRDSLFFSRNDLKVIAIDQSQSMINKLTTAKGDENIEFIANDFVHSNVLLDNNVDYVYSRFTMHSITDAEESLLINKVFSCLKEDGLFFIEARSVKDDIYGLGDNLGDHAFFYNEHYRRFIILDNLLSKLKTEGFSIQYSDEDKGYAVYKDENPVVIRVIAKK